MQSLKNSSEDKKSMFDEANFDLHKRKVKNLGIVLRGGISKEDKSLRVSPQTALGNNMDVDRKQNHYVNENTIEEAKRPKQLQRKRTQSKLSRARISFSRQQTPQQDKEFASNYLTLIQNEQRKRRFTEISNELQQRDNLITSEESFSRQDLNLNKITRLGANTGKKNFSELNNLENVGETEGSAAVTNLEYDLEARPACSTKRMKNWDEIADSKLEAPVNLDEARKIKLEKIQIAQSQ